MEDAVKRVLDAAAYLDGLDLVNMPVGKYPINDNFYFFVQEYQSNDNPEPKLESHKNYVDIQYIVTGREIINVANTAELETLVSYDPEKDIAFWKLPEKTMRTVLSAGSYIVLYPKNAHQPGAFFG